ncbi:permease [Alkalicella caledoniensis]|uniref:Permease n=2 Tax=Alkalicella caledoniensis TaxID=2731377 RepID=A0A7G9WD37_ALKCA|nr:permease [Alkalicella caledoniensis]QNO16599.1 permease [Alkalicella caledoniensis]
MKNKKSRYNIVFISLIFLGALALYNFSLAGEAVNTSLTSFRQLLLVLPPIFIILGLLDVWVPKETMVRFMGKEAGLLGVVLAFFLGSAAAGPLYGAFPIAAVLVKKGVPFKNVAIFIGAWSTTKIPMLMFELSALGLTFTATRLLINIPIIIIIANLLDRSLNEKDRKELEENMERMA